LKNKGRGGCKDRLLLQPGADPFQAFMGHVNGILDLILTKETVTDPESIGREMIVHGSKEPTTLLFLGPDEGTASYMDLLALRAKERGYKYWPTISTGKSKEYGGISHDEIGATSEGVITFMEEALKSIKIDPGKDKFTIVQTGDTEGDLGRNNIRILYRKYRDNAVYKAVVGGKGCIADTKGLDIEELNRLAEEKLPIIKYNPDKLSDEGSIVDSGAGFLWRKVGGKIEMENIGVEKARQIWSGLVATEKADVLLPCGGRQNTITGKGDKSYPYSITVDSIIGHFKVISEGANVFFGENARIALDEKGTLFIKDITANQNGVNFSFTEVAALLTLSVEEFLSIRDKYIKQGNDVNLLNNRLEFRMINEIKEKEGTPRPAISADINREINRIADIIRSADWINEGYSLEFLFNSLPHILIDNYKDRILKQWPASYRKAMTAAAIAQRLVFDKGINYVGQKAKEKNKTELAVIKEFTVKWSETQ
jgi:glutamate dehydrogenase